MGRGVKHKHHVDRILESVRAWENWKRTENKERKNFLRCSGVFKRWKEANFVLFCFWEMLLQLTNWNPFNILRNKDYFQSLWLLSMDILWHYTKTGPREAPVTLGEQYLPLLKPILQGRRLYSHFMNDEMESERINNYSKTTQTEKSQIQDTQSC